MPLRAFDSTAFETALGGLHRLRSRSLSIAKGNIMSKASKSRSVISLRPILGAVRSKRNGTSTSLHVTFKCPFAPDEQGLGGSSVSIGREEMYAVAQFAETAYGTICELLANERKAKKSRM
jgi:hypothetical protein